MRAAPGCCWWLLLLALSVLFRRLSGVCRAEEYRCFFRVCHSGHLRLVAQQLWGTQQCHTHSHCQLLQLQPGTQTAQPPVAASSIDPHCSIGPGCQRRVCIRAVPAAAATAQQAAGSSRVGSGAAAALLSIQQLSASCNPVCFRHLINGAPQLRTNTKTHLSRLPVASASSSSCSASPGSRATVRAALPPSTLHT